MAATILNSTKQGDKYVSESFEMTSDNAGLQVTTKDDSESLLRLVLMVQHGKLQPLITEESKMWLMLSAEAKPG